MFKLMKYMLTVIGLIGIIIGIGLFEIGYEGYQKAIGESSIQEQVEAIRNQPTFVAIEEVDQDFLNAIVAVEDHRFYKHGAMDTIGFLRAVLTNVAEGELTQGGSSITQQLAKNMYFSNEQTLERKLSELFVAVVLERDYEKEELLELYINKIYFGKGCYGIKDASEHFLGKLPEDMTVEEAAYLAGLPQSPSRYAEDEALAQKRQQVVLAAMASNGYID